MAREQQRPDLSRDELSRPRMLDRVTALLHPLRAQSLLLTLALPTFGLAFAISMITTFGPVVLIELTDSPSTVGALIGGEGAFALVIPLLAGTFSDRLPGPPATRRFPFVLAGAPLVIAGLVLLPLSGSIGLAAAAIAMFFVGYYLYYPPYRALSADLLPRRYYARAQAEQAVLRGAGLGVALLAGGLLLSLWAPLPFTLAAATVVLTTLALMPIRRQLIDCGGPERAEPVAFRRLLGNAELRTVAIANALWEFSFSGLKSFIVLYIVRGLDRSAGIASAVIAVVAIAYVVGAPLAGRLAERHGLVPVLRMAALIYGGGLLTGVFAQSLAPLLVALPLVALAGAIVMTLPQALAFTLAPPGSAGAAAGLLDFSRGVGVVLGPLVVGGAIELFHGSLPATDGYAAMWPVIAIPVLLTLPLLRTLERKGEPALGQSS
jgi:MFS family permease